MKPLKNIGIMAAVGAGAVLAMRLFRQQHAISFDGRSVVITGGSRGLGLVIVRKLAAEGADLTIMARDADEDERPSGDRSRGCTLWAYRRVDQQCRHDSNRPN